MNYNQSDVTGTKWTRASRVMIENPIGAGKTIGFVEEDVIVSGDGTTFSKPSGYIAEPLTDMNLLTEFQLRNPITGDELGVTAKYMDVQVMLHSLYYFLASRRDDLAAQEAAEARARAEALYTQQPSGV